MSSTALDEQVVLGSRIASDVAEIFEVNDNRGRDWEFQKQVDGHGWLVRNALADPPGWQTGTTDETRSVALGAVKSTDVLVVGIAGAAVPPWATLDPRELGRRAAWFSLGFLLRGAASRHLEVETGELDVGVRAVRRDGYVFAQVFLADSLANGAGYCTHLGQRPEFQGLLDEAARWVKRLADVSQHTCDSACYDCLKDYRNSAYHGLLDWRLAADLLTLLRGEGLDPEQRWKDLGSSALAAFCKDLNYEFGKLGGIPAAIDAQAGRALITVHPFEHLPPVALAQDRHAKARLEASAAGLVLHTASLFELLRAPSAVFRAFAQA